MEIIFSLKDINEVVQKVYEAEKSNTVWAFNANMGAGKTTFINALCAYLKVSSPVSSPTFSIINEYQSTLVNTIYHMDWYRLKSVQEAVDVGVEDVLLSGHFCLIEWPTIAKALLPDCFVEINLEVINETTRKLTTSIINSLA